MLNPLISNEMRQIHLAFFESTQEWCIIGMVPAALQTAAAISEIILGIAFTIIFGVLGLLTCPFEICRKIFWDKCADEAYLHVLRGGEAGIASAVNLLSFGYMGWKAAQSRNANSV